MAPSSIEDLIKEPFGPYPDHFLLDPKWKPEGRNLPQLRNLRLRLGEQFIGLDTCERYVDPPAKPSSPVSFFGVLTIEDLGWLSERGKTALERELNKRDEKRVAKRSSQNSVRTATPRVGLTLKGLYGQRPARGSRIRVWIMCEKHTPAMFMTAKGYPESLLIGSKDPNDPSVNRKSRHRVYEILSMDTRTYSLSTNFLERYRLVTFIEKVVAQYKTIDQFEVDNFVNAYLLMHKEKTWSHATIFAQDPLDDEELVKPRLRHVSHAEVRATFAAHSGWLLAFYLRKSGHCPIDVRSWCEFIGKVRVAKRAPRSGTWGQTYEDDDIWASDEDDTPAAIAKTLAKFGGTADIWEKRILSALSPTNPSRLFDDELSDDETSIANSSKRRPLAYDPDFSEPSTPGCSDSEDDFGPPSNAFIHMAHPPTLRPGRFVWDCPISRCDFSINLLDLGQAGNNESLPEAVVRKKQFDNFKDEQLQKYLSRKLNHIEINK
ncbi:hypothetical protein MVEN_02024000 [Mycena venus]|uniref:Uncharacterized protein n=1 Tax=Mycena venus TaxID=2733690 RepID=A0A8H6XCC7_9AGAR|nr:hypothetical protein MVEN_02024000 [Mycena venus]